LEFRGQGEKGAIARLNAGKRRGVLNHKERRDLKEMTGNAGKTRNAEKLKN
jgi:hypothetical protein